MAFETKATITTFGGKLLKLQHQSPTTKTSMSLNLYLPPAALTQKVPVLFYLSGLTCTADNVSEKGFLHAHASKHGLALVFPDTSPRGASIPGEDDAWDFGSGAGFYVDATRAPWSSHYNMYSYVTRELPSLLWGAFPELDGGKVSISGHSMGGHGALTLALKNPGMFRSVSAFAPITNPSECAWGKKAFEGYFGSREEASRLWAAHDATELVKGSKGFRALIDVGTGDGFYKSGQLLPENFEKAAREAGAEVEVRYQKDYDHSYYFISTFGEDHVAYHAKYLKN